MPGSSTMQQRVRSIDEICCVSTGRTGTNYVFGKLKGCRELLVNYEILNRRQSHVDWEVRDFVEKARSMRQEDLDEMARTDKGNLLNLLRKTRRDMGRSCMIYKVFPTSRHLTLKELEKLIIRRHGVGVILLIRNPLKVFLSIRKANKVGSYAIVDTSDVVVDLPPKRLVGFIRRSTRMYQSTMRLCGKHGTPFAVSSYEKMFEGPTDRAPEAILLDSLNTFMDPPLRLSTDVETRLRKQDRSDLADGIANFDTVRGALKKAGYGALLNGSKDYQSVLDLRETRV